MSRAEGVQHGAGDGRRRVVAIIEVVSPRNKDRPESVGDFAGKVAGVVAWGLHMGLTQGLLSAEIAGAAPHGRRGTAFGVFGLLTGAATLAGNLVAGALWAGGGAPATFGLGLACAGLCLPGVLLLPRARPAA